MNAAHSVQFLTPETIREMGTSFRRNHFWDRLGGQAIVMIGWWYSRQPLTNHKDCLSTKRSQKSPVGTPPHEQQRQMSAVFSGSQAATVLPNGSEKRWRQRWKKARPQKTWALILSVVDIIIVIFIIMLEYNRRNLLKKNYLEGASTHFSTYVRTPYGMTLRSRRCVTKRLQCWE